MFGGGWIDERAATEFFGWTVTQRRASFPGKNAKRGRMRWFLRRTCFLLPAVNFYTLMFTGWRPDRFNFFRQLNNSARLNKNLIWEILLVYGLSRRMGKRKGSKDVTKGGSVWRGCSKGTFTRKMWNERVRIHLRRICRGWPRSTYFLNSAN